MRFLHRLTEASTKPGRFPLLPWPAAHLRQRRVPPHMHRAHVQRAMRVEGTRDDVVAHVLGHRPRLARDHALVHVATPPRDHAVSRDLQDGSSGSKLGLGFRVLLRSEWRSGLVCAGEEVSREYTFASARFSSVTATCPLQADKMGDPAFSYET